MGIMTDQGVSTITVLQHEEITEENKTVQLIEILRSEAIPVETENTTQFVEVFRDDPEVTEVTREAKIIEAAYPVGSLVNVGVGPELPAHPYEGQVWIKI